MADYSALPTSQLFHQWRTGDANAGQAMAQRFSDWYFALTTSRLGDLQAHAPLQRACVRFQQGILSVGSPTELVEWAHGIVAEEVRMAGGRVPGADSPNALTGGRAPSELISAVAREMDRLDVKLLSMAYNPEVPQEEVVQLAEAHGGYPFAVLRARLHLKQALRDRAGVPFGGVPDKPNLDAGPLPLYEAGRISSPVEEAGFEKWLLSDMALCKDVAEFAAFALALRSGFLRSLPETPLSPAIAPPAPAVPAPAAPAAPAAGTASGNPRAVIGVVVGVLLLIFLVILIGAVVVFVL